MKRVLLVLFVACGAGGHGGPAPSHTASAVERAPHAIVTARDRIVRFASARGGLHGEPVRMPYRRYTLRGAECWLFFVGGDAAHAAWLATPWDPTWGKASAQLPDVSARTQAALLDDGVVYERVAAWPRAVRVTKTALETRLGSS